MESALEEGVGSAPAPSTTRVRAWPRSHRRPVNHKTDQRTSDVRGDCVQQPNSSTKQVHDLMRHEVLERDQWRCRYCGQELSRSYRAVNAAHVDHIIPVSRGGCSTPDNLVAACRPCNSRKSNMLPAEWGRTVKPIGYSPAQLLLPFMETTHEPD